MEHQGPKIPPLPDRLNLEMVAAALGISELSEVSQLYSIAQYQSTHGLILKSQRPLSCNVQRVADGYEEHFDLDGKVILFSSGDTFPLDTAGKPIKLGPIHTINSTMVGFAYFNVDGEDLYLVDETGVFIRSGTCAVDDLYVDRADLADFLNGEFAAIPTYADPTSEFHAPELALAIKLHQALRVEKWGNPERSMHDRVYTWLRKNMEGTEPSDAMVRRLSTVIHNGKKST